MLNEVYLARNDLPKGFGGWQVLDSSPQQEREQGTKGVSLGPAPQLAVKRGLGMRHNAEKFSGLVNGLVRSYLIHGDKSLTLAHVDASLVGRKVCTKAVGVAIRGGVAPHDITVDYKDGTSRASLSCEWWTGEEELNK